MVLTFAVLSLVAMVLAENDVQTFLGEISGIADTMNYWDCCKPSCAWKNNIKTEDTKPINTCDANGEKIVPEFTESGCNDGTGFMCNNHQPWIVKNNSLAYGFVSASFSGGISTNLCCACFKLDFIDQIIGKSMIVQVANLYKDFSANHFHIAIPGGGVGIFNEGCHNQWNASLTGWGHQYTGVYTRDECSTLPSPLAPGCQFRFDFLENARNPRVIFTQIVCPLEISARSGCRLDP